MKVIKQSYKILNVTTNAVGCIADAARTCYQSQGSSSSSSTLVRKLVNAKHDAMLEFASMTVRFTTNRGVSHEFVRHRLCSFAQESTRYCKYVTDVVFIEPSTWPDWSEEQRDIWRNAMIATECAYGNLLELSLSPQQARSVLPNDLKTELVVQANFREWKHIFELRCSKAAHPDIRALLRPLQKQMQFDYKEIFE